MHEAWSIRRPGGEFAELQAFVIEEMRIANASPSCRVLTGVDSRVLQRSMCYAVGGDIYNLPMYFHTAWDQAATRLATA